MVGIGLIGLGYWGPNIARNLYQNPSCELRFICDIDSKKAEYAGQHYPNTEFITNHVDMLESGDVDAVAIALPAANHYAFVKEALQKGKHVLVEKPLALRTEEARELVELAQNKKRVLMVGHTFLYNAAVRAVKKHIDEGDLGDIYYIYSQRLNLGRVRSDINAMWNLAPHDVSIVLYWLNAEPVRVSAKGITKLQDGIEDVVFLNIDFENGVSAHIHTSWLDPGKTRKMTVVGTKKMIVYDDISSDAKIRIYDKGIDRVESNLARGVPYDTFGQYQLLMRSGDVHIPRIDFTEPLKVECGHFIDCIVNGEAPMTDGDDGLEVVRVLEAGQISLKSDSKPVELD